LKITADTNLLVRLAVLDDARQAKLAADTLAEADLVALPMQALCEFVWVMRSGYDRNLADIARTVRAMLAAENTITNRPAAQAGLAALDDGGDFADGVIAFEGSALGGAEFVSFDRGAVMMLKNQGRAARLLA
jgi:predicted nucleic-acid-binding protein